MLRYCSPGQIVVEKHHPLDPIGVVGMLLLVAVDLPGVEVDDVVQVLPGHGHGDHLRPGVLVLVDLDLYVCGYLQQWT